MQNKTRGFTKISFYLPNLMVITNSNITIYKYKDKTEHSNIETQKLEKLTTLTKLFLFNTSVKISLKIFIFFYHSIFHLNNKVN